MESTDALVFFVNGKKVQIKEPNPETTLLEFLRNALYLTGTKLACGQGACGACTVMISSYDVTTKSVRNMSVNACLVPICYLHGMAVTTVEGVGSTRNGLHPVQKSLVESHGLQCGFCTPGMVMTMYTLFRNNPHPSQEQMEKVLEGNLCRCTGYRPIVDAFRSTKENCPCGLGLCLGKSNQTDTTAQTEQTSEKPKEIQDVIFPPELKLKLSYHTANRTFRSEKYTWYRPTSMKDALSIQKTCPGALFVMGCNTIGYLLREGKLSTNVIICCTHVPELQTIHTKGADIKIGAGITMGRLEAALLEEKDNKTAVAMLDVIRWIGVDQIRNTATLGGHVMSQAPNLDLQAFLLAAGASLEFMKKGRGTRLVKMDNDFIENVGKDAYRDQLLLSVKIPNMSTNEHILGVKQPDRRGFAYGIVTTGMYVQFRKGTAVVQDLRLAFGGIDTKPILATKSAGVAISRSWNGDLLESVTNALSKELQGTVSDNMRFRITLASSFFFKFFLKIKNRVETGIDDDSTGLPNMTTSGLSVYDVPDESGTHVVWKPIPNVTSEYITAGEALFVDDISGSQSELFAGLVTSAHAHAKVVSVDLSGARALEGVVDVINHSDVPFHNKYGVMVPDHLLFSEGEVFHHGQVICAVLAVSRKLATRAAKCVRVTYELMDPIITMEDAIKKDSYLGDPHVITRGNIEDAAKEADFVVEGESETGAQEHLYMETQSALVIPRKEQKEIDVFTSTQAVAELQTEIAKFLGLEANRVTARVRRAGGAFGGKSTDSLVCAGIAAVGAWKTNRPVRCVYDRDIDVRLTGKRHPVKSAFKVYGKNDGKIVGIDIKYHFDAGYSTDVSPFVMMLGMVMVQGCYDVPHIKAEGRLCRTNKPSNTAFRGFGSPQIHFAAEAMIQRVSHHLKIPAEQVRGANLLRKGFVTPFKMEINDDNVYRCWEECKQDSDYENRAANILKLNSANRWRKRGMSMIPIMFPIGYPPLFMNQAGALVLVYKDGSVLLTHSGVELGQGIHTKMIQIAATTLEIPHQRIIISEVSTATIPNTTETGGSNAADLNAGAVLDACKKIKERLAPFKEQDPDGGWEAWVTAAHFSRISLSATGFYTVRDEGYDFLTNIGRHAHYFVYGVANTEVEIDCLTGEHQLIRTDIVMDVGKSLNPAIDVGQIEGGFVQGCGMMTTEEFKVDDKGHIHSVGPLNYKIPGVRNIPRQMNVKLLKDGEGVKTVYSAKGIGEPPFLLASSTFYAIKEAILAARKEENLTEDFLLKCPATVEVIRMACQDKITRTTT